MASAFYREKRGHWVADFRALFDQPGKRSTIRVPSSRIRSPDSAAADALSFAQEIEHYCRLLETSSEPNDIAHAKRIGAITGKQEAALSTGNAAPQRSAPLAPLTIKEAALAHPSTSRDNLTNQVYYLKLLDDFTALTGCRHVADITLAHATLWVSHLKTKKWKWDSRRHALLYLRRAATVGTSHGLPNVLAGYRLDHKDRQRTQVRVWSLSQLLAAITNPATDKRVRAALILGGCLGLRPTETLRATIADIEADVLKVGQREAKTDNSVRSLPIPAVVLSWLSDCIGKRTTGAIVQPIGPRAGDHLTLSGLHQLLRDALIKPTIGPKDLRKTFATWASQAIPAADLERYLGHASILHAAVTARHYLAAHQAEQLRPSSLLLNAEIIKALTL